jgi:hypothetical protein
VLSKDQALAAADALIFKVETERRLRLERRTALLVRLYPALKHAPPEERRALVWASWNSPVMRWAVGAVTLATVLTGLWAWLGGPSLGIDPAKERPYPLVLAVGAAIPLVQYFCTRAFLRREVPSRYPKNDTHAPRSGA